MGYGGGYGSGGMHGGEPGQLIGMHGNPPPPGTARTKWQVHFPSLTSSAFQEGLICECYSFLRKFLRSHSRLYMHYECEPAITPHSALEHVSISCFPLIWYKFASLIWACLDIKMLHVEMRKAYVQCI
jgi:hypothetical protein